MYNVVKFEEEEESITDFLSLPRKIYSSDFLVQNEAEERQLLTGTHILSHYFTLQKYLIYNENHEVCGRCVITNYPDDTTAYLGFFECIEDLSCFQKLIESVIKSCKIQGTTNIVGPVDCSFWIRYRLKVSDFQKRPYISEPYQPSYYLAFFQEAGFLVKERYVSNLYPVVTQQQKPKSYFRMYQRLNKAGYKIVSPKKKNWDLVIGEIYTLISELYADFPAYKALTEEDFRAYFANYKPLLDLSMVKMVYLNQQPVAFFIGMPDYGNRLYGKLTLVTLLQLLYFKKFSRRYVLLYMGVKKEHMGVGLGVNHVIMEQLAKRKSASIGAFIHSGKVTERYWQQHIEKKYQYVLLEKIL